MNTKKTILVIAAAVLLIVLAVVLILFILNKPVRVGSAKAHIEAFVLIKEYDSSEISISDEIITEFAETKKQTYEVLISDDFKTNESGFVYGCRIFKKDSTESSICFGFETEQKAKEYYEEGINVCIPPSMNQVDVRIGRYVFRGGCRIWPELFRQLGIPCSAKEYTVYSSKKVSVVALDDMNKAGVVDLFESIGYRSAFDDGLKRISYYSPDGDENFLLLCDKEEIDDVVSKDSFLIEMLEDQDTIDFYAKGLTCYVADDFVLIGRGNVFEKLRK